MSDAMTPGSSGLPEGANDPGGAGEKIEPKITSHPWLILGCIAATVPFFFHITSSTTTVENGVEVAAKFTDFVALIGGGLASFFGALFLVHALSRKTQKGEAITVALLIDALGIFHLLRGIGIFH